MGHYAAGRRWLTAVEGRCGEGDMNNSMMRGRVAPLLGGLVATSMLTFTAGTASAVQPSNAGNVTTAVASSGVSAKPVLSNEFGTMRSNIKGTFGRNGVVTGTFKPARFVQDNGRLMAIGTLTATLTRANGKVVGTDSMRVKLPVKSGEGTSLARTSERAAACDILSLVLGPLDLDILGLRVQLNRVVLNITAEPGPGNLLGNLLCAVAGLLDNSGVLTQLRQILNSILAILKL